MTEAFYVIFLKCTLQISIKSCKWQNGYKTKLKLKAKGGVTELFIAQCSALKLYRNL